MRSSIGRLLRCLPFAAVALSSGVASAQEPDAANVMPLTVKGLSRTYTTETGRVRTATAYNRMVVSLKICVHDTTHCTMVDNVMVDTGSVGLRLQSGVLSGLALPDETSNGTKVAECFGFTGSNVWGDVKTADVYFGGVRASGLAIQVASDTLPRPVDGSCKNHHFTPASNGTLGIGWGTREVGSYYGCSSSGCTLLPGPLPAGVRLLNPVAALGSDNNGEIFELPPASASATKSVKGWLILGVNTRSNNRIDTAVDNIIALNKAGDFTTSYGGSTYNETYIDSGTQTSGFYAPTLGTCSDQERFYCVATANGLLDIKVAPGDAGSFTAQLRISTLPGPPAGLLDEVYDDLVYARKKAAPNGFAWGLPFFLEKRVALVQSGSTPVGLTLAGPFYAFRSYEGPSR